ncbi:MAG: 30S ribosomal protein S9, partial [Candidatus Woesearchaeota archaeon]
MKIIHVSGTRKKAIARATLREGTGLVRINSKRLDLIQPEYLKMKVQEPLLLSGELSQKVNIDIDVFGGGINGQADASRVAIARALVAFAKDKRLERTFLDYDRNILVPDVRQREPRKPNTHGNAR